jgi:hypothetical protein
VYPSSSWLSPDVAVRRSAIAGFGLFAMRGLVAGTVVARLGGRMIGDAEPAALEPPYSSISVADGVHLLLDPSHPARYGNHSCAPNLWHVEPLARRRGHDRAAHRRAGRHRAHRRLRHPHRHGRLVDAG